MIGSIQPNLGGLQYNRWLSLMSTGVFVYNSDIPNISFQTKKESYKKKSGQQLVCHSQNICEVTLVGSLKPFCPVHMVSQI